MEPVHGHSGCQRRPQFGERPQRGAQLRRLGDDRAVHGLTAHPNSLTTLDYPQGILAFRWFLTDEVPATPEVRLVKLCDAPTSVDASG